MSEKYIHIELIAKGAKIMDEVVTASENRELTEEIILANLKETFVDKDSGIN